jgi:hypothetical protein
MYKRYRKDITNIKNKNIFEKTYFTLREFCHLFVENNKKNTPNNIELYNLATFYIELSNNRENIDTIKKNKGYLFYSFDDDKKVYLIDILYSLDKNLYDIINNRDITNTNELNKIVNYPKDFDILLTWEIFEKKVGLSKKEIETYIHYHYQK